MASIADHVSSCLGAFNTLLQTIQQQVIGGREEDPLNSISAAKVSDQQARFKIWAGNIGAHRTGRSSLDYRLRDASHLHSQTTRLLESLARLIGDATSICSGETVPWDQQDIEGSSFEFSDVEEDFSDLMQDDETELSQITSNVADMIDCLFRLTVSIRNPAPHDRFSKRSRVDLSHYERFDVAYVRDFIPALPVAQAERLGKAITRRREYLAYRQSHHQKLSRGLEDGEDTADDQTAAASTVASSLPPWPKAPDAKPTDLGVIDEDQASETGGTETTVNSDLATGDRPRIPPLPSDAYKGPFVCPFCNDMIVATSTKAWIKHVLRVDIRPFICLSPDCSTPGEQYAGRREWARHVLNNHWKSWQCALGCVDSLGSAEEAKRHFTDRHPDIMDPVTLVNMSELPKRPGRNICCELCFEQLSSFKDYIRHVGRHQKSLALFALPKLDQDQNGNIERQDSHEAWEMDKDTVPSPTSEDTEEEDEEEESDIGLENPFAGGASISAIHEMETDTSPPVDADPAVADTAGLTHMYRPEMMQNIKLLTEEERTKYERGLAQLWKMHDNHAQGTVDNIETKKKIAEFGRMLVGKIELRKMQQAQQGQQSLEEQAVQPNQASQQVQAQSELSTAPGTDRHSPQMSTPALSLAMAETPDARLGLHDGRPQADSSPRLFPCDQCHRAFDQVHKLK
ncbi:hypothetical protein OQA88_5 [Cercophora sp. LCS_1]